MAHLQNRAGARRRPLDFRVRDLGRRRRWPNGGNSRARRNGPTAVTLRRQQRKRMLHEAAQRLARAHLPGVEPETVRDILQTEANKPMRGPSADLQHGGLFGDGRKQKELF